MEPDNRKKRRPEKGKDKTRKKRELPPKILPQPLLCVFNHTLRAEDKRERKEVKNKTKDKRSKQRTPHLA